MLWADQQAARPHNPHWTSASSQAACKCCWLHLAQGIMVQAEASWLAVFITSLDVVSTCWASSLTRN